MAKETSNNFDKTSAQLEAEKRGFGELLREAREAQGISLGDMAVRSRLSVAQLRAIEAEEVEALPEPVYVRAFIRGYAQSLGLDGEALVADYAARCCGGSGFVRGQVPEASPAGEIVIGGTPKHRGLKIALLFALVILVGAGIWAVYTDQFAAFRSGASEEAEQTAEAAAAEAAAPAAVEEPPASARQLTEAAEPEAVSAQPEAEGRQPEETQQAEEVRQAEAAAPADEPQANQADEPDESAAASIHSVQFLASGTTWVQVTDPEGKNIVAREMRSGGDVSVEIPKGSRFTIGNPDAIRLVIDGTPYGLEETVRNGVSRFTIE